MPRGRPPIDNHFDHHFLDICRQRMEAQSISRTALADRSRINRGTVSRVFSGEIPIPPRVILTFADTLGLDPALKARFAEAALRARPGGQRFLRQAAEPELISSYNYPRSPLIEPVTLLVRGFYPESAQLLRRIFDRAANRGDLILEADAAARTAWLNLEIGDFVQASQWARRAVMASVRFIGLPLVEILQSAAPLRPHDATSRTAIALRILSDALHLQLQVHVTRMLYLDEIGQEQFARVALERSLELDRRLDLTEPTGNDLRWKAVMEASGSPPDLSSAARSLAEAEERFARGGLYEAHFENAFGVVHLRTRKRADGRDALIEAKEKLSTFTDSRGLALTMYLLSDAPPHPSDKTRMPLRYLLAAGAIHPYGFLIDRCRRMARFTDPRQLQREIDSLLAGNDEYIRVHRMMGHLAKDSSHTSRDLLYRNMRIMLSQEFPQVKVPFPQRA